MNRTLLLFRGGLNIVCGINSYYSTPVLAHCNLIVGGGMLGGWLWKLIQFHLRKFSTQSGGPKS